MNFVQTKGFSKVIKPINLRKNEPSLKAITLKTIVVGEIIPFVGWVTDGENFQGNTKWFKTEDRNYFWSGNVEVVTKSAVANKKEGSFITADQLCGIIKSLKLSKASGLIEPLNKAMLEFLINTPLRQAAFIAQTAHESAGYSAFIENLNYSMEGLMKTWPKRFDQNKAKQCSRQPQEIANCAYSNRMGNGDEASGDGWKYRGRGIIQITGKNNYTNCGLGLKLDLVNSPELLEQPLNAFRSGAWFWNSKNLNPLADKGDLLTITKLINGGVNGLNERTQYYNLAKSILLKA